MLQKQCLICSKSQRLRLLYPARLPNKSLESGIFSARRTPDKIHYRIVQCQNCGLVFSSPIFPPQKIAGLYRQSNCSYQDQLPFVTQTYWQLFERFKPLLSKSPRVLEVGCGTGFFLKKLRQEKINDVWGVEPGEAMVNQAPGWLKRRIKTKVFSRNLFKPRSFEVVICFHTLDHMIAPKVFVGEAYKILKPGGIVIIVVHDSRGLSVKLLGERSPIFDIEHIYLFDKITLAKLFKKHKFKLLRVDDLANTYPLGYWLKMGGIPQVFPRLKLYNKPLKFKGGNIFLVAQK